MKLGSYGISSGGISMKTNCNCDYCGKRIYKTPYQLRAYKSHYCDNTCASRSRMVRETRKCIICEKEVTRKPSEFTKNVFCGRECYYEFNRINAHKMYNRVKCTCDYCGDTFERRVSETKGKQNLYCSDECRNKHTGELFSGINHHRWNSDLTNEERIERRKYGDYIEWRETVYARDNHTCQCCGDDQGGNLVAHHIYNYSEHETLRTEVSNGITMCEVCHKKFHDEYGYTNNNQKQLIEYIQRYANQLPNILVTG